jgi:signal transduction histidine kinase
MQISFDLFQYTLLRRILLSAFGLGFVIATLSMFRLYPLDAVYMGILYAYSIVSLVTYLLSKKHTQYYLFYVHVIVGTSLFTLSVMMVHVLHDEFRLVWFFLVSFASFMLGGKRYGFGITLIIILIVGVLFYAYDLHLSLYAILTFVVSLLVFNLFTHYFLTKIQRETQHFEDLVSKEVQKREASEQVLLRKYRMANMGEMIDAIAHQWRQPLAQGNMILLNMEEELDNKAYIEEKITELAKLNEHMSQTIEDFRALLYESKSKVIFESHTLIDEVLMLMKNQLQDIDVQYTDSVSHKIHGYKNELMQVLIILLSNAIDILEIRKVKEKQILLSIEEDEEHICIHIEDNAGGIDLSVKETLFNPYTTTKSLSGGTGLGLYIAKIIIEDNMQGTLSVQSGIQGARFTLRIKREL